MRRVRIVLRQETKKREEERATFRKSKVQLRKAFLQCLMKAPITIAVHTIASLNKRWYQIGLGVWGREGCYLG